MKLQTIGSLTLSASLLMSMLGCQPKRDSIATVKDQSTGSTKSGSVMDAFNQWQNDKVTSVAQKQNTTVDQISPNGSDTVFDVLNGQTGEYVPVDAAMVMEGKIGQSIVLEKGDVIDAMKSAYDGIYVASSTGSSMEITTHTKDDSCSFKLRKDGDQVQSDVDCRREALSRTRMGMESKGVMFFTDQTIRYKKADSDSCGFLKSCGSVRRNLESQAKNVIWLLGSLAGANITLNDLNSAKALNVLAPLTTGPNAQVLYLEMLMSASNKPLIVLATVFEKKR